MKPLRIAFYFVPVLALLLAGQAGRAQQSALAKPAAVYNLANDVSLQGTVLKYTEKSQTPPIGAHVLLQTSAGSVDVHLGDARLLRQAKLNLTPGANVRFVGQTQTVGQNTIFLARLVQSGTQIVALRSAHGIPLAGGAARGNPQLLSSPQGESKGGAR